MSSIFFVFSFNDENMIDKTVKDRLEIIKIKEPSFKDKILISEKFFIPEISNNVNYNVPIPRSVVQRVVQQDKTFSGMRGIKRNIEDIISKLNVIRMFDASGRQKISFYNESISNTIDNIINAHEEPEIFSSSLYC
ncbi:hypothetical protein BDK51DRAFT_49280 [Blyttiomyces helicus]|uniref:Uncharacterized protein n=1 Tax=Blyttiomyces helicus TaxID=388810 RepID=A0A4P9VTJ8_9FUNG|nr:hypothetical protein BDK51DRAFT_49280 [Blyttiomyces helicus]|eukprot:RKO82849.1 hypothetical protein BDK51DRAFT_49280 [Blyttiomyces helicus]